jgi:hypothetical protein
MAINFCVLQVDDQTYVAPNNAPVAGDLILPCSFERDAIIFCNPDKARHFAEKVHLEHFEIVPIDAAEFRH